MLFIASLITTVGAVFLFEKCEKSCAEIAIACIPVALISLILTLVFAPWELQLVLLVLLLPLYVSAPISDTAERTVRDKAT